MRSKMKIEMTILARKKLICNSIVPNLKLKNHGKNLVIM